MFDLEIRNSKIAGKGVFTKNKIKKGQLILEINGPNVAAGSVQTDPCALQVGVNKYIGKTGKISDFVNHNCEPSTWVWIIENPNGSFGARLIALRTIEEGEEITFDYSMTVRDDPWTMECACGAKTCRKVIGAFDNLPQPTKDNLISQGIVPDYILTI